MSQSQLPILIIGGGLGGLALAQGLKNAGITFILFEKDSSTSYRPQGYRIRINGDSLRAALDDSTWDLFEKTTATLKHGFAGFDAITGASRPGGGPPGGPGAGGPPRDTELGPYTCDRSVLRSVLMTDLQDHLRYGHNFMRYGTSDKGVTAFFENGTSVEGSFLVGADGLGSRTNITPELCAKFKSEARDVITVIKDDKPLVLFLEPVRFSQSLRDLSGGRIDDISDYVYWVLGGRKEVFGLTDEELFSLSPEGVRDLTLDLTEEWDEGFKTLFKLQQAGSTPLRLTSMPPDLPFWPSNPRVTVIGDAIHNMSPTGGSGARTAFRDVERLLKLIKIGDVTEESQREFEKEMCKYAGEMIKMSAAGGEKIFGGRPIAEWV